MEGRREEYLSNKGRIHAMFADCLENAFLLPDPPLPPDSSSLSTSPILSPLDDESLLHPIANLSVSSYVPNSHVREDLYTLSDSPSYCPLSQCLQSISAVLRLSPLSTYIMLFSTLTVLTT